MKCLRLGRLLCACILAGLLGIILKPGMVFAAAANLAHSPVVDLRSVAWVFDTRQIPVSSLTGGIPESEFGGTSGLISNLTVKFTVTLKRFEGDKKILEIPNVLTVRLRHHDPRDRNRQNYPAFKMPDGSVPTLEASLVLHSVEHPDWKEMTVGIPLAMLPKPNGEHEIVLHFSGPDWKLYVDGEMLDNDFPFGYPQLADRNVWKIDSEYVTNAVFYVPGITPESHPAAVARTSPGIQYWVPPGHNNWVGDVETFFYGGRYHVFYLYDRRHHQSKFGCGAHYFEHLSTTDFKRWTEHAAATPLEEQWECIGTGVPFVFSNQFCLSYGLHTTRVYPQEKTTLPAEWEHLKRNGMTGAFTRSNTPGVPAGATYAISEDGVSKFRKSWVLFHPCENPSVYADPSGKTRLLANYRSSGIWESDTVDSGWHCVNPGFPPGGDCTIFFRWGRYDYVIGGFTGLWMKPADAPESAYRDVAREGNDFYDGSNVPSITKIRDGRFLMAGWIPVRGWGGVLVLRELIQFPDGRIGSKWMKEITPVAAMPFRLAERIEGTATFPIESRCFMLSFTVQPSPETRGKFGLSFLPEGQEGGCELQLDMGARRAQFGPGSLKQFANTEKCLREGGAPHQARNYAIEKLIGTERPFTVQVIVKGDDKLGGSIIDAEFAGQRTMVTYRPDLDIRRILFRSDQLQLRDVSFSPIPEATR